MHRNYPETFTKVWIAIEKWKPVLGRSTDDVFKEFCNHMDTHSGLDKHGNNWPNLVSSILQNAHMWMKKFEGGNNEGGNNEGGKKDQYMEIPNDINVINYLSNSYKFKPNYKVIKDYTLKRKIGVLGKDILEYCFKNENVMTSECVISVDTDKHYMSFRTIPVGKEITISEVVETEVLGVQENVKHDESASFLERGVLGENNIELAINRCKEDIKKYKNAIKHTNEKIQLEKDIKQKSEEINKEKNTEHLKKLTDEKKKN